MYLLSLLQRRTPSASTTVEYRLACSGELYNCRVQTSDWRKSDATRVLLEEPFPILVVSQPFNSYPQELLVEITLDHVTETGRSGRFARTFLPDVDVIEDLCALLTLLSRRLISPVTKTRDRFNDAKAAGWYRSEVAMPIVHQPKFVAWSRRPATIITSATGQTIKLHDPPAVGVDPNSLAEFLLRVPSLPAPQEIIYAASLYKSALELIEDRPAVAYLTLVSVAESLANIAFNGFEPNEAEKVKKGKAY
jgi:hypothetical protein